MRKIPCKGTLVFTEMDTYDLYANEVPYEVEDLPIVTKDGWFSIKVRGFVYQDIARDGSLLLIDPTAKAQKADLVLLKHGIQYRLGYLYEFDDEIMVTSEDEDFYVERDRVEHIWLVRGILFGKGTY